MRVPEKSQPASEFHGRAVNQQQQQNRDGRHFGTGAQTMKHRPAGDRPGSPGETKTGGTPQEVLDLWQRLRGHSRTGRHGSVRIRGGPAEQVSDQCGRRQTDRRCAQLRRPEPQPHPQRSRMPAEFSGGRRPCPAARQLRDLHGPGQHREVLHSLEHGAVWVTYRPDLPQKEGKHLKLDSADDPRLPVFLQAYLQGPQTPEPGAPCSGGSQG